MPQGFVSDGRIGLRPVTHDDYAFVSELDLAPERLATWRHDGVPPPPEVYFRSLWQGVLAHSIVFKMIDGDPMGLVTAYDFSPKNGTASVAVVSEPHAEGTGLALAGLSLFITQLFVEWPLRKIHAMSMDENFRQFDSGASTGVFQVVGCLSDHQFVLGEYRDVLMLSIDREQWMGGIGRLLRSRQVQFEASMSSDAAIAGR